jgi:class 3 adenylate cyclase
MPKQATTWDGFPEAEKAVAPAAVRKATGAVSGNRMMLSGVKAVHRMFSWGLLAATVFYVVLFATQFLQSPAWDKTWWVVQVRSLGDPPVIQLFILIKSQWPSFRFGGYLPLLVAGAASIVRLGVGAVLIPVMGGLRKRVAELELHPVARAAAAQGEESTRVDSEQGRDELLKRYREIESALRETERKRCTFLSIDVVGSTKMKENERELPVTITFQAYMKMLEDIFEKHSAWKQSWTPDGVMVCFLDVDAAVAAGQEVLRQLRVFNRTENLLRSRISVRCGMNAGDVPIFEDSKLEKIAHRAIDVAGHMQKFARPDTLWLSSEVHEKLADRSGFKSAGRQVDGYNAYEWSPSLALPDSAPAYVTVPHRSPASTEATWT